MAKLTILLEIEDVSNPHSDYSMSNMDEELLPGDDFLYILFKKIADDIHKDRIYAGEIQH